jgi:hypothetical protein
MISFASIVSFLAPALLSPSTFRATTSDLALDIFATEIYPALIKRDSNFGPIPDNRFNGICGSETSVFGVSALGLGFSFAAAFFGFALGLGFSFAAAFFGFALGLGFSFAIAFFGFALGLGFLFAAAFLGFVLSSGFFFAAAFFGLVLDTLVVFFADVLVFLELFFADSFFLGSTRSPNVD